MELKFRRENLGESVVGFSGAAGKSCISGPPIYALGYVGNFWEKITGFDLHSEVMYS